MDWHRKGTRYGIAVDPDDGLLRAGEPGVQLTWMDARVGDRVVTPRTGKPVEINALWFNALRAMAGFARRLRRPAPPWEEAAGSGSAVVRPLLERRCRLLQGRHRRARRRRRRAPAQPDPRRVAAGEPAAGAAAAAGGGRLRRRAPHRLRAPQPLAAGSGVPRAAMPAGAAERDGVYHQGTAWGWLLGAFRHSRTCACTVTVTPRARFSCRWRITCPTRASAASRRSSTATPRSSRAAARSRPGASRRRCARGPPPSLSRRARGPRGRGHTEDSGA